MDLHSVTPAWTMRRCAAPPLRSLVGILGLLTLLGTAGCLEKVDPAVNSVPDGQATSPANVVEITTPSGVAMIVVPGGRFAMGSPHAPAETTTGSEDSQPVWDEGPVHEVELSPFVMDRYEVTQDQYAALQLPNPAHFKGERRPVEQVRWSDAALFCNERSRAEGLEPCYDELTFACNFEASGYRLPTEAEWEYAARAATEEPVPPSGPTPELDRSACYAGNSTERTNPVGSHRPNAWGFYDMQGNVAEWCNDIYAPDFYANSPTVDPRGPAEGPKRVVRGGSWKSPADACRLTARSADDPGISDACFAKDIYGFRCVRRPTDDERKLLDGAVAE